MEVIKISKKKRQGHYCKICGCHKSNESFSGKGHAAHICKECARLSPSEQSEAMTINRLMNLSFRRLTENERNWLRNRTKDSRDEVRELAREICAQRFPHAERNQIKKQLHVKELTFFVNACTWDEYGDEINAGCQFTLYRTEPAIKRKGLEDLAELFTVRLEQGRYAKLLKQIIHYYEIFCWDEDYGTGMDFEASAEFGIPDNEFIEILDGSEEKTDMEEITPTWSVVVKYTNGTEQVIKGTDEFLPDKVGELYSCFSEYFNQEEELDWEPEDFDEKN